MATPLGDVVPQDNNNRPLPAIPGRASKWKKIQISSRSNADVSTPRSYNILTAQGAAHRRNRRHLRDTHEEWKEQSSNDGINDDLEDDRPAAHPGAIT